MNESILSHSQVGHSLGGALAALDAVFLALNLPFGSEIRGITYGTPRVGNAAFAELLDFNVGIFVLSFFDAPSPDLIRYLTLYESITEEVRHICHPNLLNFLFADPIPIVPRQFLGFRHPPGEIHIDKQKNAVSCPGVLPPDCLWELVVYMHYFHQ